MAGLGRLNAVRSAVVHYRGEDPWKINGNAREPDRGLNCFFGSSGLISAVVCRNWGQGQNSQQFAESSDDG